MKKILENWIKKIVQDSFVGTPYLIEKAITRSLFSYIGVARLQEVLKEMQDNGIDYTSLATLFDRVVRDNLEKENSDRMHAYYELLPKLDEYRKAFKLKDEEIIKKQGER